MTNKKLKLMTPTKNDNRYSFILHTNDRKKLNDFELKCKQTFGKTNYGIMPDTCGYVYKSIYLDKNIDKTTVVNSCIVIAQELNMKIEIHPDTKDKIINIGKWIIFPIVFPFFLIDILIHGADPSAR